MVPTSTVHAQSPAGSTLPPLLPAAASAPAAPVAAPASGDSVAKAKELLAEARKALTEGRNDAAVKALAQAHLAGPATNEWSAELINARKEFMSKGVTVASIEAALKEVNGAVASNPMRPGSPAPAAAPPSTLPPLPGIPAGAQAAAPNPNRDKAVAFTAQAKLALDKGDVTTARQLINQAKALNVPDGEFASGQMRPWEVELAIRGREALIAGSSGAPGANVVPASATVPVSTGVQNANMAEGTTSSVQSGVYQPQKDSSKVAPASGVLSSYDEAETGNDLYQQGLSALSGGDKNGALAKFKAAWHKRDELDSPTLAQLKDKLAALQIMQPSSGSPESVAALTAEERELQAQRQRLFSEVTGEIADAERLAQANQPLEALDKLRNLRQRIAQSDNDSSYRKTLLTTIDRVSSHIEAWVEQNRVSIELDQRNRQIENRMQVEAATQAKVDAQVQTLVDQYNDLIDQRRFPEATELAKRVGELKPGSEIAAVMLAKSQIQARYEEYELIRADKAEGFTRMMNNVDIAAIPSDDNKPFSFPNAETWSRLTQKRLGGSDDGRMLPSEKRIRDALTEPFSASFDRRPLNDVMNTISEMFGIPVYIDDKSIQEEGITRDQPVSLNLNGNSIQLKSALNQVLESLGLTYTVKNETLTIQSRRYTRHELYQKPYNVKDLILPIPNFTSDNSTGMAGALQAAYQAQTNIASAYVDSNGMGMPTNRIASVDPNSEILSQIASPSAYREMSSRFGLPVSDTMRSSYNGSGPGLGGASIQDFMMLIALIQSTVTPDNWIDNGGTSNAVPFMQGLSLIVTAPQETHEGIADLLKSLRALQELQVTIEVRFIQLQDTFFERIGVDFDMKISDNASRLPTDDGGPSVAVGLASGVGAAGPQFTSDLDFNLGNNFSVTPNFGNYDPNSLTSFGVAILSDLELFFFLEATQGNSRQNVLNAPKVTMFDGQMANIADFAERPFVVSYDPVVGDFAVAQRPVVVVLREGTQLSVQSVVSQDKRFVRMTLNPQFTRIEAPDRQFTFQGRRTSRRDSSILNPNGTPSQTDEEEDIIEGTTVQQPTVGQTSIGTTVNVPDGGTILMGGIKRLREGRVERGTPILSKIPYLNRLFKNDAIGRETTTLMMTVTPRIIIPEEEEANMGINIPRP